MKAILRWHQYRYFPYERSFALAEVRELFGVDEIEEARDALLIPASAVTTAAAERLTYFSSVQLPDGTEIVPYQARLEGTTQPACAKRQATRYSAHGLHEYKGKFNPQIVRAIGNRLGLKGTANVLDPFSGSGTTILEAAHAGWNATGIDRNPLAVMIANAKIRSLHMADGRLSAKARSISKVLMESISVLERGVPSGKTLDAHLGASWRNEISGFEYLQAWFSPPVLAQIAVIRRTLRETLDDIEDRRIFEVIVSDQLRDCSLQEPADLRIRRRTEPSSNYTLITKTLSAMADRTERIVKARRVIGEIDGVQRAVLGDARADIVDLDGVNHDAFDAIICSPPYATALPYIDTQRLSLVALDLIDPSELKGTEANLVGAREIGTGERRNLESEILSTAKESLPVEIAQMCRDMLGSSRKAGNGFRRRNTPALVYRYFRDMASVFDSILPVLRAGATAAFVVGANRTTLGGEEYCINTPMLLASIAERCGFVGLGCERMDTYQRYDLHQRNSINDEMLVLVQRPKRKTLVSRQTKASSKNGREVIVRGEAVALSAVADKRNGKPVNVRETVIARPNQAQLILGL
jgi:Putative RNA methylase family UPF0020